jgi:hypothetical protein
MGGLNKGSVKLTIDPIGEEGNVWAFFDVFYGMMLRHLCDLLLP